jgi:hypothetical protein
MSGSSRARNWLRGAQGAVLALSVIVTPQPPAAQEGTAPHDRAYWLAVVKSGYAVPERADAFELLVEMNELLGSADPVLRDQVAYEAAARWIYRDRKLSTAELQRLLALWSGNLSSPGTADAAVLRRSFSALNLSLLAALDNVAPFMTQAEFDRLLRDGLSYLRRERDMRGYEPGTGWFHATAHTADLLKFLARSPRLPAGAQADILEAVTDECIDAGGVFVWAEDGRLGQVVRSLARRADAEPAAFDAWLAGTQRRHRDLWAQAPAVDPARFAEVQNLVLVLRAAFAALSADSDLAPPAQSIRQALAGTLAKMP